jgi:hypothetical protein
MGTMNYKIIDNFLNLDMFTQLKNEIFEYNFPWFFCKNQTYTSKINDFYFAHVVYIKNKIHSPIYEKYMIDILDKLECKALSSIRINLLTNKGNSLFSDWHTDIKDPCKTAILYINNNNGHTLLDKEKNIKVESKENRILIFDSQIKHCAVSQTDTDRRVVINFNYF